MLVCHCKGINSATILKIIDDGSRTIKQIMKQTRAGTECGGCRPTIKEILNEKMSESKNQELPSR